MRKSMIPNQKLTRVITSGNAKTWYNLRSMQTVTVPYHGPRNDLGIATTSVQSQTAEIKSIKSKTSLNCIAEDYQKTNNWKNQRIRRYNYKKRKRMIDFSV